MPGKAEGVGDMEYLNFLCEVIYERGKSSREPKVLFIRWICLSILYVCLCRVIEDITVMYQTYQY